MTGIILYADIRDRLHKLRKEGVDKGPEVGIDSVTELYRPAKKCWTLLSGIPNMGKSAFLLQMQMNLSLLYGWKHALFSPENYPLEMYYIRMAELWAGTQQCYMTDEIFMDACHFIDEHFSFLYPKEEDCTPEGLFAMFAACKRGLGIDTITIDPYIEIEHHRPNNMSETEYVSQFLTKFRRFCREQDVHGWLVAHPTKLVKDKDGKYPAPGRYDTQGSSHFNNKSDFQLVVHRPNFAQDDDYVEVHVQKVRFRNYGRPGLVELEYDWRSGRYAQRGSKHFLLPRRMGE